MKTNTFEEKLKAEIKYRVEQEYEKYHNDHTFELNGKDFWVEQIVWKLADTTRSLVLNDVIGEDYKETWYNKGLVTKEQVMDEAPIRGANQLKRNQRAIIKGGNHED